MGEYTNCWIDLETRSQCDLIKKGLMAYSQDLSTEIICISYAFDNNAITTWFPEDGTPFPIDLADYIKSGGFLTAHNAQFERYLFNFVIANDYKIKAPKLTQWRCSAARALSHGFAASLGDICKAMSLPLQKQSEGRRLIRDYCAPDFLTEWKDGDKELMRSYCETDVATMRLFCSYLRELSRGEWDQYHATEQMNEKGVPIDLPFVTAALGYSVAVKADVDNKIAELTGGVVKTARARKARDEWLFPKPTEEQLKLLAVVKQGVEKTSLDKEHQDYLLACDDLDPQAEKLLQLLADAGGSASAKFKSMAAFQIDARVYNMMIFSGAGATGRHSSRGVQLQNMKRNVYPDPEPLINDVLAGVDIENPADSLGRLTRSAITSDHGLTYSDYSQIEARVLPWLANSPEADQVLDIFRSGRDLYTENAVRMFDLPDSSAVTPNFRQSAKTAVLACGFGGSFGALLNMAKNYGLSLTEEEAKDIVELWRNANPWASTLWYGLKNAGSEAVRQPNTMQTFGRIRFLYDGGLWLWLMLPSGRCLSYFKPRFEIVVYPWGDEGYELTYQLSNRKPKVGEPWLRKTISHITFVQHATQAAAADIMREAIVRADNAGLPVLFSVHDEMIVEGNHFDRLHEVMELSPTWAKGLPISAETNFSKRYGK